jgi:hypothetical protein
LSRSERSWTFTGTIPDMLEFSHFDRRHYPVVSVREGYREWLASYETTVEDERDLVPLEALDSVPWSSVERAEL